MRAAIFHLGVLGVAESKGVALGIAQELTPLFIRLFRFVWTIVVFGIVHGTC